MKKTEPRNTELNIIGAQTIIKGEIQSQGDLRIDGKVEGNVQTKTKVVIGNQASVRGDITAGDVLISGTTIGNINCANVLTLNATASIQGDIETKKIVIENGAAFNGKCNMTGSPSKANNPTDHAQKAK